MRLTRRGFSVASMCALWAGNALARDQEVVGDEPSPLDVAALQILPNLTTRMSVPVRLDGQGPFQFVIDTGAGRTVLARELATQFGFPAGPDVIVHGILEAERTPTVIVPRLEFARSRSEGLVSPTFPRSRLGVDGLLGVDLLGDYRLIFDLVGSMVSLIESPRNAYVQRMEMNATLLNRVNTLQGRQRFGQLLVVDVLADGVPASAFIDSGAQYSVGNMALYNSVAVRRPALRDRVWSTPIMGVTGQVVDARLAVLNRLSLGMTRIPELPVLFADLHAFDVWDLRETPALILGADILGMFRRVTLDFGRAQMTFGAHLGRRRP